MDFVDVIIAKLDIKNIQKSSIEILPNAEQIGIIFPKLKDEDRKALVPTEAMKNEMAKNSEAIAKGIGRMIENIGRAERYEIIDLRKTGLDDNDSLVLGSVSVDITPYKIVIIHQKERVTSSYYFIVKNRILRVPGNRLIQILNNG